MTYTKPGAARRIYTAMVGMLLLVLVASMAPAAHAAPVITTGLSWTMNGQGSVSSNVTNNTSAPMYVTIAVSDSAGIRGTQNNLTFRAQVTDGGYITSVPRECSGTGSGYNASTKTLTCNLGNVAYGTSHRVTIPGRTSGANGDRYRILVTPGSTGTAGAKSMSRTIQSPVSADLRMNYGGYVSAPKKVDYNARVEIPIPVAITTPVTGAKIGTTASFVITLGNVAGASVVNNLRPTKCDARGVTGQAGWPAPKYSDESIKCTFTAHGSNGNQWRVNVTGLNNDPANAQTLSNTGSSLPTNTAHLSSFNVILANSGLLFNSQAVNSRFEFFARADSATLGGAGSTGSFADSNTANNTTNVKFVVDSERSGGWLRANAIALDGRGAGGVVGDNMARALPGETWMSFVNDSTNAASAAGQGKDMLMCMILPSATTSARNWVYFNAPVANASASVTVQWLTSGVSDTGGQGHNCGTTATYGWNTATQAPQGTAAQAIRDELGFTHITNSQVNAWALQHLRYVDRGRNSAGTTCITAGCIGGKATYIRFTYNGSAVGNNTYRMFEGNNYLAVPAMVLSNTNGTRVWAFGSTKRATDNVIVNNVNGTLRRTIPAPAPTKLSTMADVLTITDHKVNGSTAVSKSRVERNETAKVTLGRWATSHTTSGSTGTALTYKVVLPPNLKYVAGSSSGTQPTVTGGTGGTATTLTWNSLYLFRDGRVSNITFDVVPSTFGSYRINSTLYKTSEGENSVYSGSVAKSSVNVTVVDHGKTALMFGNSHGTGPETATITNGSTNRWVAQVRNDDVRSQAHTDVIITLPRNATGGSNFSGGYTLGDVVSNNTNRHTIYYSTNPNPNDDPRHADNGGVGTPSSRWTTTVPANKSMIRQVRLIATTSGVGVTEQISIPYVMTGGADADVLKVNATARATLTREAVNMTITSTVSAPANTQVDITQDDKNVTLASGDNVTYTVTIRNNTNATVNNTVITPHRIAGVQTTGSTFTTIPDGTSVVSGTWRVPTMSPGQTMTASYNARINASAYNNVTDQMVRMGMSTNTSTCSTIESAQINTTVAGDTDGCDFETDFEDVNLKVDVVHTGVSALKYNVANSYTMTVTNEGPDPASGVRLTRFGRGGAYPDTVSNATVGVLEPGQTRTYTYTVRAGSTYDPALHSANYAAVVTGNWSHRAIPADYDALVATCVQNGDVASDHDQCDFDTKTIENDIRVKVSLVSTTGLGEGARANYRVDVTNAGADVASDVVFNAHSFLNSDTPTYQTSSTGSRSGARWTIPTMNPGATANATFYTTMTADALYDGIDAGVWATSLHTPRTAPADASQCEMNAVLDDDTDMCDREAAEEDANLQADLAVSSVGDVVPGAQVEFMLTVQNSGTTPAAGVTAQARQLAGLTGVRFTGHGGSPYQWDVGVLDPGEVRTATVVATVDYDYSGGALTAAAAVSNRNHPRWVGDIGGRDDLQINPAGVDSDTDQADLADVEFSAVEISKTAVEKPFRLSEGNFVEWDIAVTNVGNKAAAGVVVRDIPLAGHGNVTWQNRPVGTTSGDRWNVGSLNPGQTYTIRAVTAVTAGANITDGLHNMAFVTSTEQPYTAPATLAQCVGVQCDSDSVAEHSVLTVTKTQMDASVLSGGTSRWQVTVRNSGTDWATGVVAADVPGDNLTAGDVSMTVPQGHYDTATGLWTVGDLAPGQTVTATVQTRAAASALNGAIARNYFHAGNQVNPYTFTAESCTASQQCDDAQIPVVALGGLEVAVMFDPFGDSGDCATSQACSPLEGVAVSFNGNDASTNSFGKSEWANVPAGDRNFSATLPAWADVSHVTLDGVAQPGVPAQVTMGSGLRRLVIVVTLDADAPPTVDHVESWFESGAGVPDWASAVQVGK